MKKRVSSEMAFPLHWPEGQARRPAHRREKAGFKVSFADARDDLLHELKLLGARYVVISSDVPLRKDGIPFASAKEPDDPGVGVYFDYEGEQMVFACDKWSKVRHNIRAVGKTIEAIRGIARWGSSDMMKRSLHAFKALPPDGADWRSTLGFAGRPSLGEVKRKYRDLAVKTHPDHGGSHHEMSRLTKAWMAAKRELE
jgi:hypothetical protein